MTCMLLDATSDASARTSELAENNGGCADPPYEFNQIVLSRLMTSTRFRETDVVRQFFRRREWPPPGIAMAR
jgi:hypothetical protein